MKYFLAYLGASVKTTIVTKLVAKFSFPLAVSNFRGSLAGKDENFPLSHVLTTSARRGTTEEDFIHAGSNISTFKRINEKILSLCHVDDIDKEIEDADDFTLREMTAKDEISMLTTPWAPSEDIIQNQNIALLNVF